MLILYTNIKVTYDDSEYGSMRRERSDGCQERSFGGRVECGGRLVEQQRGRRAGVERGAGGTRARSSPVAPATSIALYAAFYNQVQRYLWHLFF